MVKLKVYNTMYAKRHLYFFEVDEFHYYEGEEVKIKWASADELGLKTNDEVGLRIIQRENIREIDGKDYRYIKGGLKELERIVKGSKGNEYTVKVSANGKSCTCPGFTFRGTCKHVTELEAELK